MESKESWLNLLEWVGKNLRLVFTGACSGSRVDLLELGEEEFAPVQNSSLEAGRKASRRWRALVLGSSCGWRGLRLAALVPTWPTGAPGRCGHRAARRGQVASYLLVPQLDFPPS